MLGRGETLTGERGTDLWNPAHRGRIGTADAETARPRERLQLPFCLWCRGEQGQAEARMPFALLQRQPAAALLAEE